MKLFLISITTFVLLCQSAVAQEKVLTFSEAVKIGIENNVILNRQRNQLDATSMQRTSNLARLGPGVSVRGNLGRNDGNSFNQQEGRVVNGVLDFMGASIDANMPIFNGMNRLNSYRQSVSQLESQIHFIERTNQDVMQFVSVQYLECLLDKELMKIDQANLDAQNKLLEQINQQVEAGSRAKVDAFNQEFQVKNAELQLLRSEIRLRNDKVTLAQTIQLDLQPTYDIVDPSWDVNAISMSSLTLEESYELAVKNRADLLRAQADEKAANFGMKSVRGNYMPSVNAFFSYGSQYNDIQGFEDRTFDQQFFEDNLQTTYGLSFTIPIFGGFSTRANAVQSKVDYENAKLTTENVEFTVKADVLRAYQNYRDAMTNYEATQAQLDAAKVSYDLENERYILGVSDFVQLTQANQALVTAQSDLARAQYTLLFQDILLQYAIGTLQIEDIP